MIRLAEKEDLQTVLEIYAVAKNFMHTHGNPNQWNGTYPDAKTLLSDIEKRQLYVLYEEDSVYGCFALIGGDDPTYAIIDGAWASNTPYGTIHRIASARTKKGVFEECAQFARKKFRHLRVDTHADNKPMQHVVTKNGFTHRGTIYLADGAPRLAYDWLEKQDEA